MRRAVVVAAVLALAATGALFWLRRDRAPGEAPRGTAAPPIPGSRRAPGVAPAPDLPPAGELAAPAEPPESLRGTEIDGALLTDGSEHLLITPETRILFDYFLSAEGEESAEAILGRIHAEIDAQLPPAAAGEAKQLLADYLDFRARARDLFDTGAGDEPLEERLERVRRLRREVFGEDVALALFGAEEEREAFAVEARRRLGDPALDDEAKRRLLEEVESGMPDSLRREREAALGPSRLTADEAALREAGGSPEEIRALRESRFGADAADRLEELDRRRAEWQGRLAEYNEARAAIDADASLSPAEKERLVDDLRARSFTPEEIPRVRALDEAG